jgi:hypothetical protein
MIIRRPAVLAFLATMSLASGALGQAEAVEILRVYDARDLRALDLTSGIVTISSRLAPSESGELQLELVPEIERLPESDVLLEIAGVSGLAASRLKEGIYIATGSEEAHQQLMGALDAYRAVRGQRYTVRLEARSIVTNDLPAPGEPAPQGTGALLLRSLQTVNAQAESLVQATTTEQYISGWVPVVGTQAVGYQAQYATADDGFTGTIVIGAPESPDGPVTIQVLGLLVDSTVSTVPIVLSGDELPLSTVRRSERSVRSTVLAQPGVPVILAVVNGFDTESTIILTASAVPAPDQ